MPRFRDLSVCVTDSTGNELEEWGVQHLRSQKKASAYIQAATDMAFKVTIKPMLPFQDPDLSMAYHDDCRMDEQLKLQEQEEPNDEFENPNLRGKLLLARTTIEGANFSSTRRDACSVADFQYSFSNRRLSPNQREGADQ